MQILTFNEYTTIAIAAAKEPRPRRFTPSPNGRLMKLHDSSTWRPMSWCDRCRADITGGLVFYLESGEALCAICADTDRIAAAALGISYG